MISHERFVADTGFVPDVHRLLTSTVEDLLNVSVLTCGCCARCQQLMKPRRRRSDDP